MVSASLQYNDYTIVKWPGVSSDYLNNAHLFGTTLIGTVAIKRDSSFKREQR